MEVEAIVSVATRLEQENIVGVSMSIVLVDSINTLYLNPIKDSLIENLKSSVIKDSNRYITV